MERPEQTEHNEKVQFMREAVCSDRAGALLFFMFSEKEKVIERAFYEYK